jgi:pimeloyl-ACP methyl ester carboxylesterase
MGSGPPDFDLSLPGQARLGQRIARLQGEGLIPAELSGSDRELIQAILPAYFSDPEFERPDELKHMSFNRSVSNQVLSEVGEWDFADDVRRLDHQILFIWGEDDPFGLPMAEATVNRLSSAEVDFVVLDGCGHYWHEQEAKCFSEIRRFLDSLFQ